MPSLHFGRAASVGAKAELFTPIEHTELEELAASHEAHTAARATLLLRAAWAHDDGCPPEGPKAESAVTQRWLRAYRRFGAAGLAGQPRKHPITPAVGLDLLLDAELAVGHPPDESVAIHGRTVTISHRRLEIAVRQPQAVAPLKHKPVTGRIAWPVLREDNERLVLSIRGFVVDAAHDVITVKLRHASIEVAATGSRSTMTVSPRSSVERSAVD